MVGEVQPGPVKSERACRGDHADPHGRGAAAHFFVPAKSVTVPTRMPGTALRRSCRLRRVRISIHRPRFSTGLVPSNSADRSIPRFVWPQNGGGRGASGGMWIEYRYSETANHWIGGSVLGGGRRRPRVSAADLLVASMVGRFGLEAGGGRSGVPHGSGQIQPGSLYAGSHHGHPVASAGRRPPVRSEFWSGASANERFKQSAEADQVGRKLR